MELSQAVILGTAYLQTQTQVNIMQVKESPIQTRDLKLYSKVWNNTALLEVKMVSISLGIGNDEKREFSYKVEINEYSQEHFIVFICALCWNAYATYTQEVSTNANHSTTGVNFWNVGYPVFQVPFAFPGLENSANNKEERKERKKGRQEGKKKGRKGGKDFECCRTAWIVTF